MFLRGGWLHLLRDMVCLWIFGDNVEDRLGHLRFLAFYLATGVGAALVHAHLAPDSTIPTVGPSGAISGVIGAYALLFPHARIYTLVPFVFVYLGVVEIPPGVYRSLWFRDAAAEPRRRPRHTRGDLGRRGEVGAHRRLRDGHGGGIAAWRPAKGAAAVASRVRAVVNVMQRRGRR